MVRINTNGTDPLRLTHILRGRTPSFREINSLPVLEQLSESEAISELHMSTGLHLGQLNYRGSEHDLIISEHGSASTRYNIFLGHWGDGVLTT